MWAPYLSLATASLTATAAATPGTLSAGEIIQIAFSALDLGVAGLMLWLFIQGKLHSSEEMDHEREARQKAEEQRDEALRFNRDQVAPLLSDFVHATGSLLPILQALVTRLELPSREDTHERARRERR